jgi:D-glycero-D-manno-heptose 1,7-bisphosphate phosphatase
MIPFHQSTKKWSLFLDRDGVINEEVHNDYVHHWHDFKFYPGSLTALEKLSKFFNPIVVVTNQRGVGKGLTKLDSLLNIHHNMQSEVLEQGGRIDEVYFCPDVDTDSPNRKPNIGMGLKAKTDFPEIDFNHAIMVGNTLSDMMFGKNLGMFTVFIASTRPEIILPHPQIDLRFNSLLEFSDWICQ